MRVRWEKYGAPAMTVFLQPTQRQFIFSIPQVAHASGEDLSPPLLLYKPMISCSFHSTGQCGIAGRKQHPIFRSRQDFTIGGSHGVWRWTGCKNIVTHSSSASLRSRFLVVWVSCRQSLAFSPAAIAHNRFRLVLGCKCFHGGQIL